MNLDEIIQLRHVLHSCPESSGREVRTKALLMDFLKSHTAMELIPCGDGFYAAHREGDSAGKKPSIALRADYDALALPDGTAAHRCGHDGHAAALCGASLLAEEMSFGRDVFFLFQPPEEIGEGAEACLELFERESVGELLCALPDLTEPSRYTGMTMCTVIGAKVGDKALGQAAAAAEAEVWLTLRGEHDTDLERLYEGILTMSKALAEKYGLSASHQLQDVFPSTENTPACAEKVRKLCHGALLEAPMRWSEDFGYYLKVCPGAFFGIGAGEKQPPLHTEKYEYPDELLEPTMEAFLALMASSEK